MCRALWVGTCLCNSLGEVPHNGSSRQMACSLGAIKNKPVVRPMFSDTLSSKEVIRIKNSLTDI